MSAEAPRPIQLVDSAEIDIAKTLAAVTEYLAARHNDEAAERKAEAKRSEERRSFVLRYILPALAVVIGGGTFGGVQLSGLDDAAAEESATREVATVEKIEVLSSEQGRLRDDVRTLAKRSIAQDVQIVEGIRYLDRRLTAMSPDVGSVPKPDALVAAEKRVDAIKQDQAIAELFAADEAGGKP